MHLRLFVVTPITTQSQCGKFHNHTVSHVLTLYYPMTRATQAILPLMLTLNREQGLSILT